MAATGKARSSRGASREGTRHRGSTSGGSNSKAPNSPSRSTSAAHHVPTTEPHHSGDSVLAPEDPVELEMLPVRVEISSVSSAALLLQAKDDPDVPKIACNSLESFAAGDPIGVGVLPLPEIVAPSIAAAAVAAVSHSEQPVHSGKGRGGASTLVEEEDEDAAEVAELRAEVSERVAELVSLDVVPRVLQILVPLTPPATVGAPGPRGGPRAVSDDDSDSEEEEEAAMARVEWESTAVAALRLLCVLADPSTQNERLRSCGAVKSVVRAMMEAGRDNPHILGFGTRFLHLIVRDYAGVVSAIDSDAVPALLVAAQDEDPMTSGLAALALYEIADDFRGRAILRSTGAVAVLHSILGQQESASIHLRATCMDILCCMAKSYGCLAAIRDAGVLPACVGFLREPSARPMHASAAKILALCSGDRMCAVVMRECGGIPALLNCLQPLQAEGDDGEDSGAEELLPGAVDPSVADIACPDPVPECLKALIGLMREVSCRKVLHSCDGLAVLAAYISPKSSQQPLEVQAKAALAVALAMQSVPTPNAANEEAAALAKINPAAFGTLSRPAIQSRVAAGGSTAFATGGSVGSESATGSPRASGVADVGRDGVSMCVHAAIALVEKLSPAPGDEALLSSRDTTPAAAHQEKPSTSSKKTKVSAKQKAAMERRMAEAEAAAAEAEARAASAKPGGALDRCVLAIAQFTTTFEERDVIRRSGGLPVLSRLLVHPQPHVRFQACAIMAALAQEHSNRAAIRDAGAIPNFLANFPKSLLDAALEDAAASRKRLESSESDARELHDSLVASRELREAASAEIAAHSSTLGGRSVGVSLSSPVPPIRPGSLNVEAEIDAEVIALEEENRASRRLEDAVAAVALHAGVEKDLGDIIEISSKFDAPAILMTANTAEGLANLMRNKAAREAVIRLCGVAIFVKLLSSQLAVCRRNAAWALAVVSISPAASGRCIEIGGLHALQTLSGAGFTTPDARFAADAVQQILNHSLSAKHSLQGHLSSSDRILDGFHDAGRTKRFQSLSTLSAQPVNNRREVLVVDAVNDPKLAELVYEARELAGYHAQAAPFIRALAQRVSRAMGGSRPREDTSEFAYGAHIAELKVALGSNAIPVGLVKEGTFYHRALVFKVLVDRCSHPLVSVSLHRGTYTRAWNVANVDGVDYAVDLMHNPGVLVDARKMSGSRGPQ